MLLMLALRFPQSIVIEASGAWSWLAFPGIGTIQPAEFMKIFLVLALAHIMYRHHAKFIQKTTKSDLWLLAKMMFASLPPMGLIMVQPDLGSALKIGRASCRERGKICVGAEQLKEKRRR